jgi:hypothetical protein
VSERRHSPLVMKLLARFRDVDFREAYLPDEDDSPVYGEIDYNTMTITINPVPHVVDTLIHELIHMVYPKYSERAVCSLTGKVMKELTESELKAIYEEYKRKVEDDN